jgi:hypothetical protein
VWAFWCYTVYANGKRLYFIAFCTHISKMFDYCFVLKNFLVREK